MLGEVPPAPRTALTILTLLCLVGALGENPVSAIPASDFTVDLHLDEYDVKMPVSTEQDTTYRIPGWVDVNDMRVGETVSVHLTCTSYADLDAGADPPEMVFGGDGRQHFNLTLLLREDSPIDTIYYLHLAASGETLIDSATADADLTVEPIYRISATAELARKPGSVAPGGETRGIVRVTNTGTILGEYYLEPSSDPDSVVFDVAFTSSWEAELTPGFNDEFEFRVNIADDAPPGDHEVTFELWGTTQYDTGEPLDTFTVVISVDEEQGIPMTALTIAIILILGVVIVTAFLLRRKA
jgi:hypothetical protein